ncbi:DUF6265 family protein [Sphingomonas canadensis]|uniref:DUF6265 family protein n=1 Tax=Sphingomonas canadensis TaxID=1219257 RepID=A0ABW3H5F7_9SPHN|nr:DUF6265 family protein [Sphingomonas canadensis]MCW3836534.1 DUF6265 family protein [Sphingomonas canadensis]
MRSLIALAAAPMIAGAAPAQEAVPMPAWMAGTWCTEGAAAITCERWSAPAGGMMLGSSQTVKGGRTVSFEYLRVTLEGAVPVYTAQPGGGAAVAFRAAAGGDRAITFANPGHDYPQRIRYWREGDSLNAEIALADGSKPMRWRYLRAAD